VLKLDRPIRLSPPLMAQKAMPRVSDPGAAHKPKKKAAHFCTAPFHVD
jgi:hypothetical protein